MQQCFGLAGYYLAVPLEQVHGLAKEGLRAHALELPEEPTVTLLGEQRVNLGHPKRFGGVLSDQHVDAGVGRQADEQPRFPDVGVQQGRLVERVAVDRPETL